MYVHQFIEKAAIIIIKVEFLMFYIHTYIPRTSYLFCLSFIRKNT